MAKLSIFPTSHTFTERSYHEIQQPYSYGGFLELRNGTDTGTHLGVDITVNDDKEICVTTPVSGMVYHVMYDSKDSTSWGGRVIIKTSIPDYPYILYGHLDKKDLPAVGTLLSVGDVVGYLAPVGANGSWFRHLHIQQMSQLFIDFFSCELEELDGYGHDPEEDFDRLVCDPIKLISC